MTEKLPQAMQDKYVWHYAAGLKIRNWCFAAGVEFCFGFLKDIVSGL